LGFKIILGAKEHKKKVNYSEAINGALLNIKLLFCASIGDIFAVQFLLYKSLNLCINWVVDKYYFVKFQSLAFMYGH